MMEGVAALDEQLAETRCTEDPQPQRNVDDDGYVYIVDRTRDVIISGGFNVFPSEVEQLLWGHPVVTDCAVIGVPAIAQSSVEVGDVFCARRVEVRDDLGVEYQPVDLWSVADECVRLRSHDDRGLTRSRRRMDGYDPASDSHGRLHWGD